MSSGIAAEATATAMQQQVQQQQEGQSERSLGELLYQYRGTPFDKRLTPEHRVQAVQGYDDVRDDDVIICTYPKSGTHWACDIALKIVHNGDLEKSASSDVGEVAYEFEPPAHLDVEQLGRKLGAPTLEALSKLPSPRIIYTHLLFDMLPQKVQDGRGKVIYVCRDPRDILVSFWHHQQAVRKMTSSPPLPWELFLELYLQEKTPYGPWAKHYRTYENAHSHRQILFLYYEQMKEDLRDAVSTMAKFLGKELSDEKIDIIASSCTIEAAKAANPYSQLLRRGVAGGWTTQFTVCQSERFDAHMDKEFTSLELDIPYWPHSQIKLDMDTFPGQAYRYQGITFLENVMPFSRVRQVYNYNDVRPDDVIIWSVPRSGTHWAADIAAKVMLDGDLDQARKLDPDIVSFEISPPPPVAGKCNGPAPKSLKDLSGLPSPRIILTHLPFRMLPRRVQQGEAKIIYVDRDPRDVAVSTFHLLNELFSGCLEWEKFLELFLNGKLPGATWWNIAKDFQLSKKSTNILALHYEETVADLKGAVKKVAEFLHKDLDEHTVDKISGSCTFAESKKTKPLSPFIRQGKTGGWKNFFTVQQLELFERRVSELKLDLNLRG